MNNEKYLHCGISVIAESCLYSFVFTLYSICSAQFLLLATCFLLLFSHLLMPLIPRVDGDGDANHVENGGQVDVRQDAKHYA